MFKLISWSLWFTNGTFRKVGWETPWLPIFSYICCSDYNWFTSYLVICKCLFFFSASCIGLFLKNPIYLSDYCCINLTSSSSWLKCLIWSTKSLFIMSFLVSILSNYSLFFSAYFYICFALFFHSASSLFNSYVSWSKL